MQTHGEIERCLSAKLNNYAFRLFYVDNVHYVFEREWLEIKSIRGVVIRGDRFGITVDHDGFKAGLA